MLCLRLPTHQKWMLLLVAITFVTLTIVTPALADYLGPNREVTQSGGSCQVVLNECQYVPAKGDYRYHQVDNWSCANESKPWQAYPSEPPRKCSAGAVGEQYWSRDEGQPETVIYPPATIIGSLQNCTLQNGWCITVPQLNLTGSEPVSGYTILALEGTLNGQTFACSTSSCSVSLNEGDNNFTYWALSSWGDSSTMGTLSARVDTAPPDLSLDINGSSGANGWYVSPVTLTPTGSDSVSGFAGAFLSVNNGAWQPSTTLNDGVYDVAVTASDNAGNTSNSSTKISVDTTTPSISLSVNGTSGRNGWFISNVEVSALASDATSGLGSFEVSVDGSTYQSYSSATSFLDGHHTIRFKAIDNAGNTTETPIQEFYVDTIAPAVELPVSWELGRNIPYNVQDTGSGLAALRLVIEDEDERYAKVAWNETVSGASFSQDINWNGQFRDGTIAPAGTYLVWLKASDKAGNERIKLGKVVVPEKNIIANLFQVDDAPVATPLPPDDLSQADDSAPGPTFPMLDFGGSITETQETTTNSVLLTAGTAASIPASSPNVLWGAAAAATIGAATAYALAERRKRDDATEQLLREVEQEERRARRQEQQMQKLEAKWAQEKAWEEAQEDSVPHIDTKIARMEFEDAAKPTLSQGALQKRRAEEIKELVEEHRAARNEIAGGLEFIVYPPKQEPVKYKSRDDVYIPPKEEKERPRGQSNWWEKTKAWVREEIIEPLKPAAEKIEQFKSSTAGWVNENVYQDHLKLSLEKTKQFLSEADAWITKNIEEPITNSLRPAAERTRQFTTNEFGYINENVYQPYLQHVYQPYIAPKVEKLAEKITEGLTWANENFYQPYIRPGVEKNKEFLKNEFGWINENVSEPIKEKVYEPYLEPVVSDINKYIFQPYIQPVVDEVATWWKDTWDQYGEWVHTAFDILGVIPGIGDATDLANGIIYLFEGRYIEAGISVVSALPVLGDLAKAGKLELKIGKEALEEVSEVVIKDGVETLIEKAEKEIVEEVSEKAVKEAGETLVEKATKIGVEEVEQGIHTTLDVVGRLHGFGEVSSIANALTYLARGKIFDASVAVMSMVPLVGSLGVTGLQGLKIAKEFLETTVREASESMASKLVKETLEITEEAVEEAGEEFVEKATKETIEEIVEDGVKEAGEEFVEKATKETVSETIEDGVKETSEELFEKTAKETVEEATQKTVKEVGEEAGEGVSRTAAEKTTREATDEFTSAVAEDAPVKPNNNLSTKATEDAIADDLTQRKEETSQPVDSLKEKYGDRVLDVTQAYGDRGAALIHQYGEETFEFVQRAEQLGVDPTDILDNPPSPGQSLEGWLLRIDDPANPVNHPRGELKLTEAERDNILARSTVRSDSNVVVLGYGGGVEKPYFELSDEVGGCHLSLSSEDWAPFEDAKSNFWTDINAPFIESAIKDRKIFLFNVAEKVISDPKNIKRFSLPELRLIEMDQNNYAEVSVKGYTAYVPIELIDTYKEHLPPSLVD